MSIVANVSVERAHADRAYQCFLPSGPLALLPLRDPRACSIVWSADRARAQELMSLQPEQFEQELATASQHRLGKIKLTGARAAFPLALAHALRYVGPRVALIGDAAHTVHPLAGQGANLGLLDSACLTEVLLTASAGRRDVGAEHVLRRYERWRKGENLTMLAATGGFKYLFGNDWPIVARARNAGLALTNRVQPLKNFFMRRACGLEGDLPKAARRPG